MDRWHGVVLCNGVFTVKLRVDHADAVRQNGQDRGLALTMESFRLVGNSVACGPRQVVIRIWPCVCIDCVWFS